MARHLTPVEPPPERCHVLLAEIVRTWDQKLPAADTVGRVDPEITELLAALNPLVRRARALTAGAGGNG